MENQKEIWKDVPGYEGIYQVSNLGRIKSMSRIRVNGRAKILTKDKILLSKTLNDYVKIGMTHKYVLAHRLIAKAFIPNPDNKPQVNHINGIKHDNRVENLEWVTASENAIHSSKNKLSKTGEKHWKSKLSEKDIKDIRSSKLKQCELAKIYNIKQSTISQIILRRTWKYIN